MKFTTNSAFITSAIRRLSCIPGAKGAPSANLVKFTSGMSGVDLSRITPEGSITISMSADVLEDDGEFIVDYSRFSAAISRMSGQIDISSDDKWVMVNTQKTSAKLAAVPSSMMFEEPEPNRQKGTISVDVEEFSKALQSTRTAMLSNSTKPGCDGVQLRVVSDRLSCIGADGKRLHVVHLSAKGNIDVLIPFSSVNAIVTALDGIDGMLKINRSESALFFAAAEVFSRMQISEQVMSNIQPIVDFGNEDPDCYVVVDREVLMNAIKTAKVIANERGIHLRFIEDALIVTGDNAADAEINESIDVLDSEGELDVRLNAEYLSDLIAATVSDEIRIAAYTKKGAIFIKDQDRVLFMAQIRTI